MGVAYQQRAKSHLRGQTHGCMLITAVVVGCTGQLDLGASAELNATASVSGGESEIMLPHDYLQDRSATTVEVQCNGRGPGDATACDCAIPGKWTKLKMWVSQAHFNATRVEGGDSFSATLRHTHPNYHYPTCVHCPNGVVTGGTGEHRCREATNELGRLCPYEIHSAATDGRASEDVEIIVINSHNNGVYYVSYMTTIPGLYDLEIQLDGAHVRGSPFAVEIANGDLHSTSAAWTEITGATDGATAGEWANFTMHAHEANGAARVEGGDSFSVTLRHTHPNYHYPTCVHCPNGVVTGGTGEHRCREATNELGRLCPYEIHSAATDGRASEDVEIIVINSHNNGVYYVSYMTTIPGLYDLEIQLDGAHVRGSPFAVEIANGESQFWPSPWQWWGNGQGRGNGLLDPSPSRLVVAAGALIACMMMPWCYMGFRVRRLRKIASVNVAPVASRSVVYRKHTQR